MHFYRLQRSWGKVIFSQASVILFTGGVCLSACWDTTTPTPQTRHPPGTRHPQDHTHPQKQAPSPPTRHPHPQDQEPPSPPAQNMLGDTVNERAVRILLECNLVFHFLRFRKLFQSSADLEIQIDQCLNYLDLFVVAQIIKFEDLKVQRPWKIISSF